MTDTNKIRRTLRRPFETAGFKLLQVLIPLLPRYAVVGLSRGVGRIAWLLPLREKRIGMQNLNAVFGDTKTPNEKRRILTASFSSFCQTMLDVFWFSKNPERRIPKYVHFDADYEPFFQEKAHIYITAHFGGWEVMAQSIALRGADLASIAATVKNRHVDELFRQLREKTGQTIIPQKGALRTMIHRIRNKQTVGFVLDQNTDERDGGIVVDFLGLPMSVSAAPAGLAYRTGTELFFGFCRPEAGGKYLVYSLGSIQPPDFDKTQDADQIALELTQQIQDKISAEIRKYPEFWLWSYKHWRRKDGSAYPAHYPDY